MTALEAVPPTLTAPRIRYPARTIVGGRRVKQPGWAGTLWAARLGPCGHTFRSTTHQALWSNLADIPTGTGRGCKDCAQWDGAAGR